MNKSVLGTIALVGALTLAPPVHACGEGLFNMGQGLRYQGYLAPRPATVLVYADDAAASTDRGKVYRGLAKAGHKVTVARNPDELVQAMRARRYDVVIARFDRVDAVTASTAASTAKPKLLPVVERSQRNAPAVRSRFNLFLLDGASLGQYLKLINQLVQARAP